MTKYAILVLDSMRVLKFSNVEDCKNIITDLTRQGKTFQVFQKNELAGVYSQQELYLLD